MSLTDEITSQQIDKLSAEIIASESIVILTGAGVSVASGIAPFRKNPNAIWERSLTERGTLKYFLEHPVDAWLWYSQRFSGLVDKEPNEAHYAIADLETWCIEQGIELTLITQNIDRLHKKAGSTNLIEIHGRSDRARCVQRGCDFAEPKGSLARREIPLSAFDDQPNETTLPRCPRCHSLIRPHVLWFDETYNSHVDYQYDLAVQAFERADLIIAVGTSFSVGITELALHAAALHGALTWNIDIDRDPNVEVHEWLIGQAEHLAPMLVKSVRTRSLHS